ncbi:Deoxyribodipyrimidine photolyase, type II [Chondromyces apiculatus DSM 436]|uniref:Deoxyribodipyrimidine photo-lyase n=2 Tax=Chondromyces apiculatus TaxID=51 RepID=A0A017SUZ3_9BACT|nr:Deoxyribodipyrimidine photolyase, type II [Chondromyces apiculatus DSM 436]
MTASRRTRYSFGLQRALDRARELDRPLVVLEALRVGYRWASDRLHRFALEGMSDNAHAFARAGVLYHPYVEPSPDHGKGLLAALAARAAVVVTDDSPTFFLPRMVTAAARQLDVLLELVDGSGLLPVHTPDRVFTTARSFRIYLQRNLAPHLAETPVADPLHRASRAASLPRLRALPRAITERWPAASAALLTSDASDASDGSDARTLAALAALPIDHTVSPVPTRGGQVAAERALTRFLDGHLDRYIDDHNDPDRGGTSHLSPYLHWGHLSPHEILAAIARREGWTPDALGKERSGAREGFWGMSAPAEAFLEQLVTWREIGFNMAALRRDHDRYDALPGWALDTLHKHARDPRPRLYTRAELTAAATYDPVWNASQRELLREGRIHNYLRMLWGKKILEWSKTPEEALDVMLELNDRFAIDGRDPNSISGIFWVLGRYDRAWGPERPIYGTIRYMTSESALRKLRMKEYLKRYGTDARD